MEIRRSGSQPSGKGPDEYFTGTVRIDPLFQPSDPARAIEPVRERLEPRGAGTRLYVSVPAEPILMEPVAAAL